MSDAEIQGVVRPLDHGEYDVAWARAFLELVAGGARMVSRGQMHQCHLLPGFYFEAGKRRVGLLTYRLEAGAMEVVSLHVKEEARRRGVGAALLAAACDQARQHDCRRLWLVTTNDNEPAQRFYRSRRMRLVAIHQGAVDAARRDLKPEIPLTGVAGVPIRDELEFEIELEEVKRA